LAPETKFQPRMHTNNNESSDAWILRSAAAALPDLHAYHMTVRFDDAERLVIDLYNVIVTNGRFVASGLPIAPEADPGDRLIDAVLIPKRSVAEMALLAAEVLLGKHLSTNTIIFRRAKKISVRSQPGMWFNADGELVGNAPTVFQVLPRAIDFVINTQ
jgi:diacylglycerol kinase (ATP)